MELDPQSIQDAAYELLAESTPAMTNTLRMLSAGRPFAVACSGGADSVYTALLAWAWARQQSLPTPFILHVNHATRGEASDADADFVRTLAVALEGCQLRSTKLELSDDEKISEEKLREKRMSFFLILWQQEQLSIILTGHQQEDVAETMLMRLARGSGLEGLLAPRPAQFGKGGMLFGRPLLDTKRSHIRAKLKELGVPWCEDASNATNNYLRNRIRSSVLPVLDKAFGRDVCDGFARARRLLEEDANALDSCAAMLATHLISRKGVLNQQELRSQPKALQRRLLWLWLFEKGMGTVFTAAGFEALIKQLNTDTKERCSAGSDHFIESDGKHMRLMEKAEPSDGLVGWGGDTLTQEEPILLPTGAKLAVQEVEMDEGLLESILAGGFSEADQAFLDADAAKGLSVRGWRAGDRYQPLGGPGTRKVSDLFTDKKIKELERKRLPFVLNRRGDILWIPGLPPAHFARISEQSTKALWLTYSPS